MRRVLLVVLALLLVFGMVELSLPRSVYAYKLTPTVNSLAPNSWDTGTEVAVDFAKYPAPEWLQLLANPVKLTAAGKICHEFRGGQFGWIGEIRQLKDGKWVKIESTAGWVPTTEGKYMICAQAPSVGTYALFGFFDPPEGMVFETPPPPPLED